MKKKQFANYCLILGIVLIVNACAKPIPWPESPLYDFSNYEKEESSITSIDSVKKQLIGHYAHYDVVSY